MTVGEKAREKAGARPALHTEECCSHLTVAMLKTSQDPSGLKARATALGMTIGEKARPGSLRGGQKQGQGQRYTPRSVVRT